MCLEIQQLKSEFSFPRCPKEFKANRNHEESAKVVGLKDLLPEKDQIAVGVTNLPGPRILTYVMGEKTTSNRGLLVAVLTKGPDSCPVPQGPTATFR